MTVRAREAKLVSEQNTQCLPEEENLDLGYDISHLYTTDITIFGEKVIFIVPEVFIVI